MTEGFRKTAPEPLPPVSFSIPKPIEKKLQNGLKIVLFEDRRLPLVSYRLAFRVGDINDPKNSTGLTSAIAAMITEGTENRSSLQLAEEIERLGASLSANASADFTIVSASALSLYSSTILRFLAEVALQPTFPESELDLYRRNTIEHLKFQRSQPGFLANEQAARILYGDHPYSKISPKPADIERLTQEGLAQFHREIFIPNNAVFIAVGDFDSNQLITEIEDLFGEWTEGEIPQPTIAELPARNARSLTIVDRPGSSQSNIVITILAIERNNPDYFPFLVMNQILGAGASSRIFMNLREEKGYTYGAYTRFEAKRLAGDFDAAAEVRTSVTGDSLKEFFYELERIKNEKVREDELSDAKSFLTGIFPMRSETQEGLTNLIVNQQLYNLADNYLQSYRDNVNAVTISDVELIAKKYLYPEKMAIVIVGDAEEILPQATAYAETVEIFDIEGMPKDIAGYGKNSSGETADVNGKWDLMINFQGQQLPVSLSLAQTGEAVNGELETMLGNGKITDGKVKGSKLSASASTEMQGQAVEFMISGSIDGDSMTGTITAPIVPEPLSFSGTRGK